MHKRKEKRQIKRILLFQESQHYCVITLKVFRVTFASLHEHFKLHTAVYESVSFSHSAI